jgi:predicted GTPase
MSKLPALEQRIKERIQHVKNNIHPAHNPIYTETLNIEIETLQWALNEITSLRNSLTLEGCHQ